MIRRAEPLAGEPDGAHPSSSVASRTSRWSPAPAVPAPTGPRRAVRTRSSRPRATSRRASSPPRGVRRRPRRTRPRSRPARPRCSVAVPPTTPWKPPPPGALRVCAPEFDKRRKPLLLGLAAIVLALGALQAINSRRTATDVSAAQIAEAQAAPGQHSDSAAKTDSANADTAKADASKADASKADASPTETARVAADTPARPDPETTQSISEPASSKAVPTLTESSSQPAQRPVPKVAALGNLAGDLGAVPTGLAQLRKAALEGDGASVYDLAARALGRPGHAPRFRGGGKAVRGPGRSRLRPGAVQARRPLREGLGRGARPRPGQALVRPRGGTGPCPLDA